MGPHDDAHQDLESVRSRYPAWEIRETLGGYVAVPRGVPLLRGMFLESLAERLSQWERENGEPSSPRADL